MATTGLELTGGRELEATLKTLEKQVQKKIIKKATRAGARIIRDATRTNAQGMVGGQMGRALARFTTTKQRKKNKRGSFVMRVMLSEKGNDTFVHTTKDGVRHYIPHALEFGHDSAAPRPFMRNAADSKGQAAVNAMKKETARGIEEAAKAKK